MTAKRTLARLLVTAVAGAVAAGTAALPAAANEYDLGCVVYPGVLVGEDTWTQGCPKDVVVTCAPACGELKQLVKPLTYYVFDTADYLVAKACDPEPRLCE